MERGDRVRYVAAAALLAFGVGACAGRSVSAPAAERVVFHLCTCPNPCSPSARFDGFCVVTVRVK